MSWNYILIILKRIENLFQASQLKNSNIFKLSKKSNRWNRLLRIPIRKSKSI